MGSTSLTVRIINYFILSTLPWIVLFLIIKDSLALTIAVISLLGYVVCRYGISKKHHAFFKTIFIAIPSFDLMMYDALLGPEAMVPLVFLSLIIIPFFIYETINMMLFFNASIPMACYLVTITYPLNAFIAPIPGIEHYSTILSLGTFLTSAVIITFSFYTSKKSIIDLKEKETRFLESEIKTLKKIIVSLNHTINNQLMLIITNATVIQQRVNTPEVVPLAQDIKYKGYEISKLLKKLSKLKKPVDTEYAEGITMLDIDASEYESDEALDKTPTP
ncbi:MAG: hypothetical protein ACO3K7_03575 [Candidatus Marinamargulisbacteria bacterium]